MHLLSCEHITMQYDGRNVVNDISFFLDPGDYLCIVGENGSGKSTLMRGLLGLKPLAGRTRPYDLGVPLEILVRKPGDFSFPSGHTAAAMAAAVALIPAGKRVFYPMLALACVMGFSRLYFMVHYPTDVLAGAVCGALCGWAALSLLRRGEAVLARRRAAKK